MFSQIKDRKHIEQNFYSVAKVMPPVGTGGAGGVKNFSVGICDGAPSTARSSLIICMQVLFTHLVYGDCSKIKMIILISYLRARRFQWFKMNRFSC